MGIRFACHVCQRRLNIKRELAGRRGICPVCAARIRIPLADCETSTPVDDEAVKQASPPSRAGSGGTDLATRSGAEPLPAEPLASDGRSADALAADDGEASSDGLAEQPDASWYVRPPSGGQYGPATTDLLRQWISDGRVAATALLWREGWPQWREARESLPQYADRLPECGPTADHAVPATSDLDLPAAAGSQATSSASDGMRLPSRSRWTRTVMTVSLLSVLALSLIGVLAFAITR